MIDGRRLAALVPIKEHSERVPGKNFRDFCGRPLYHHIVCTLDRTGSIDEIVIDTDSQRVMDEAGSLSPKVRLIERPAALRGGAVSTNRVFAHDLTQVEADVFLQTHATNPLLRTETICRALNAFLKQEGEIDSLFSVNEVHSRFYFADGHPVNHDPSHLVRTQDLPPIYEENSCLYVFTRESFGKRRHRIGEHPLMFPIPRIEACDIDDVLGFRLAEILALYAGTPDEAQSVGT